MKTLSSFIVAVLIVAFASVRADACCVCSDGQCVQNAETVKECIQLCKDDGKTVEAFNLGGSCSTGGCKQVADRIKFDPKEGGGK